MSRLQAIRKSIMDTLGNQLLFFPEQPKNVHILLISRMFLLGLAGFLCGALFYSTAFADSSAEIISFNPPTGQLERGQQVQATITVKNTGNDPQAFWVGLSFAGPGKTLEDWPEGWYNAHPQKSNPLPPGEMENVSFSFIIPESLPKGEYKADTAIWGGYNSSTNLMVEPIYAKRRSVDAFVLEREAGTDDLFPLEIHSLNEGYTDTHNFRWSYKNDSTYPGIQCKLEKLPPLGTGSVRFRFGLEKAIDSKARKILGYTENGLGNSQIVFVFPNNMSFDMIKTNIEGEVKEWQQFTKDGIESVFSISGLLGGSLIPTDRTEVLKELVKIGYEVSTKAGFLEATSGLVTQVPFFLEKMENTTVLSILFDSEKWGQDIDSFQSFSIEFDVSFSGVPQPFIIMPDIRYQTKDLRSLGFLYGEGGLCPIQYVTAEMAYATKEYRREFNIYPDALGISDDYYELNVEKADSFISISISPKDKNGNAGAVAPFSRTYLSGTSVTVSAPQSDTTGKTFSYWEYNGNHYSQNPLAVTMDSKKTVRAVYVEIDPSSQIEVAGNANPDTLEISIAPGDERWFGIPVLNTGQSSVTVDCSKSGTAANWATLESSSFTLESQKFKKHKVTINVPDETTSGMYSLNVKYNSVIYPISIKVAASGDDYSEEVYSDSVWIDGENSEKKYTFNNSNSSHSYFDISGKYQTHAQTYHRLSKSEYLNAGNFRMYVYVTNLNAEAKHDLNVYINDNYAMQIKAENLPQNASTWFSLPNISWSKLNEGQNIVTFKLRTYNANNETLRWRIYDNIYITTDETTSAWRASKSFDFPYNTWKDIDDGYMNNARVYADIKQVSRTGKMYLYNNGEEIASKSIRSSDSGKRKYWTLSKSDLEEDDNLFVIKGDPDDETKVDLENIKLVVSFNKNDPVLEITKSLSSEQVLVNEQVTVTVTVTNTRESSTTGYDTDLRDVLPDGLEIVSGNLNKDYSKIDFEETETNTYTIKGSQPGRYILPSARIAYENIHGDDIIDESSPMELVVIAGSLEVSATILSPTVLSRKIEYNVIVTEPVTSQPVQDAVVQGILQKENNGNWETVQTITMGWSPEKNSYLGYSADVADLGSYRAYVVAQKDLYGDGQCSYETFNTNDTDDDGLLDTWEQEHFGDLTQRADDDYDGDTETNLTEYTNETDPADARSVQNQQNEYLDFHFALNRTATQTNASTFVPDGTEICLICRSPEEDTVFQSGTLTKPRGASGTNSIALTVETDHDGDVEACHELDYSTVADLLSAFPGGEYKIDLVVLKQDTNSHLRFKINIPTYTEDSFPSYVIVQSPQPGDFGVSSTPMLQFDTSAWDYFEIERTDNGEENYFEFNETGSCTVQIPQENALPINVDFSMEVNSNDFGNSWLGSQTQMNFSTKTNFSPTVTGLNPTHGSSASGTNVVITGTNFENVSAIKFGTIDAISYTVNTTTQITATAPTGTAGSTVDVSVTTSAGTSSNTTADDYGYDLEAAYTLLVNSSNASSVPISSTTGHGGTTNYSKTDLILGAEVTLSAPSTVGEKSFNGWTGSVTSTNATINLTMDDNKTVTANYTDDPNPNNITFTYSLHAGWNLICAKLNLTEASQQKLREKRAMKLSQVDNAYVLCDKLSIPEACWVFAPDEEEITLTGTSPENFDFEASLHSGWNFVGPLEDWSLIGSEAVAWGWNGQRFYPTTNMLAGHGYWLYWPGE